MAERCEVPWSFPHLGQPCPEPAYVVIRDPEGDEGQVCEAHWLDALRRSGGLIRGVRLVRQS
jgi:hypothetical protein